jgi:cytochrome P450
LNHAGVSHDEKIWEESTSFCPHRHEKKSHPFATFPFGAGSRMCPGKRIAEMELQVLTATILQKYELKYEGPVIENNLGLLINPKWTPETKLTFHKRK